MKEIKFLKGVFDFTGKVQLNWENPDDMTSIIKIRIMRGILDFANISDTSKIIYEGEVISSFVDDTEILPKEIYYYSIYTGEDTDSDGIVDVWNIGQLSKITVTTFDINYLEDVFYDKLPFSYRKLDSLNNYDLKRFCKILSKIFQYVHSRIEVCFNKNMDITQCDEKLIPYHADDLAVIDLPELPAKLRRQTLIRMVALYKIKGTIPSIIEATEIYTDWEVSSLLSNNSLVNFADKLSYSNDKIGSVSFSDSGEPLFTSEETDYDNWGNNKNFSIDFGESIDTDGNIDAFINTDKKGGGRFGDTRYIDSIGFVNDICKYTFSPSSVNNPPIVVEPEVIERPIFDVGGGAGSEGISWSRHQYVENGFLSGINIHHWKLIDNDLGLVQGNVLDHFNNVMSLSLLMGFSVAILIVRVPIAEKDTDLEKRKLMRLDLVLRGFIPVNYILVVLRKYV